MEEKKIREEYIKKFFNKTTLYHSYLEKRFGVNIRAHITRQLLGEITNSRILDIGCGDGTISLQYASQNNQLTFIDLSEKMLGLAKDNTPKLLKPKYEYLNMNFLDYFPAQPFDVVMCIGVLAHVQSLNDTIEKLYSLMRGGGLCVIQFTDNDKFIAKINNTYNQVNKKFFHSSHKYLLRKLSYEAVCQLFSQQNFKMINQSRFSFLWPGMGRLSDQFLYKYQLFTLNNNWLSKHGSEVIILMVKS